MPRKYDPVMLARMFLYVRELPGNRGQRVEAIQHWSGGVPGDSWCAHFATMVLDLCYQGKSPLPRTGSCDEILAVGKKNGWVTTTPTRGDLYLRVRNGTDAHHVGFVVETYPDRFTSISGNTNTNGSDNGDGVYEKPDPLNPSLVFLHLPT